MAVKRKRPITNSLIPTPEGYDLILNSLLGALKVARSLPLRNEKDAKAIRKAFLPAYRTCADLLAEFGHTVDPKKLILLNVNCMVINGEIEITFIDETHRESHGTIQPHRIKLTREQGPFIREVLRNLKPDEKHKAVKYATF